MAALCCVAPLALTMCSARPLLERIAPAVACTQKDGLLRAEIVAHSRLLSAMDLHPVRDVFATVSEDATLAVWSLPIHGQKARCLSGLCCAVAVDFCSPCDCAHMPGSAMLAHR